ncbi:hypothetical protein LIER_11393 [Lithospermum erythrorhizon]|uniref:Retrovirus-related Pol polyprotein from transposon TNT 1-94-like beta-barrel domain-containing protein n=1 Tax=Lithospermum erythrorhizon TaxID=34254 RepID=A0AAV3PMY6_LITER
MKERLDPPCGYPERTLPTNNLGLGDEGVVGNAIIAEEGDTLRHTATNFMATTWEGWYFDSGCSKHMTGNKSHLSNLEEIRGECVTFGGGEKGKITGKGCLNVKGLPKLRNVLLVDGLTVNLISISQLSDEGMNVVFTKDMCIASNVQGEQIMKGSRSIDNYYLWTSIKSMSCIVDDEVELWHKRLEHTNYKNIQ